MNGSTGKYIIAAGVIIVAVGIIVYFFSDRLNWFGRLPGDVRVEKENFRFYFPLVSMTLISIALSIILYLIRKFFH